MFGKCDDEKSKAQIASGMKTKHDCRYKNITVFKTYLKRTILRSYKLLKLIQKEVKAWHGPVTAKKIWNAPHGFSCEKGTKVKQVLTDSQERLTPIWFHIIEQYGKIFISVYTISKSWYYNQVMLAQQKIID